MPGPGGTVTYANPIRFSSDDAGSPRAPSSPRSLASLKGRQERLVLTGMSLEEMFMAVDPDGSGVVDAGELVEFAALLGVDLSQEQAVRLLSVKGNLAVVDTADTKEFGLKLDRFEELIGVALLQSQDEAFDAEVRAAAATNRMVDGSRNLEPVALGCLRLDNPFRALVIRLVHLPQFDSFILLLIVVNALQMAMEDPLRADDAVVTEFDRRMQQAELAFSVCFTMEMLLKVVALGLYKGDTTYLQSPWNVLDGVVVTTAWLPLILPDGTGSSAALRAFRLLRPLRTINRFPGLKRLVTTILLAIPQMQVLVVMVLIYLFTFACVAVQLWQGIMLQRCHTSAAAVSPCSPGEEALCAQQERGLFADDSSAFCDMSSSGKGLPWEGSSCPPGDTCELHHTNPYYGVLSFDNLLSSFIPVLQMATVSSWQEVMHITQSTRGYFATIYFIFGTIFGGYFLFNLFVAVLKSKLQIVANVAEQGAMVFREIDVDGSGDLDVEELGLMLNAKGVYLSEAEIQQLFEKVDLDGDGAIDLEEFTHWLRGDDLIAVQMRERMNVGSRDFTQATSSQKRMSKIDLVRASLHKLEPSNDWHTLFSYYDLDGDNAISVTEFSIIVRRDLNMRESEISDAEIKAVFADIDQDGQGDVDAGASASHVLARARKHTARTHTRAHSHTHSHMSGRGRAAEEFAAWVVDESVEAQWLKLQEAIRELGAAGLEDRLRHSLRKRSTVAGQRLEETSETDGRAQWKRSMRRIIDGRQFRLVVVGLVSANTAVIAMDHHNIEPGLDSKLHRANMALTIVFVLEMAAKVVCYTRREFNATAGWKLDLFMAVGALADTVAFIGIDPNVIPMLDLNDVFIIARVIRPLRLVYTIPALQPVYTVSIKTLAGLVYILFLIGIFTFIFSILGMQLFGGEFGKLEEEKPRAHYDSFAVAFTTTFQIMTFDSWQLVMYNGIRAGGGVAALYFVAWVVLGSMVMLNLLLVIIMEVYVSVKESFSDEALQAAMGDMIDIDLDEMLSPIAKGKDAFEEEEQEGGEEELDFGASCGIFAIDSKFREVCVIITHSKHLDHFVLMLILANCVTMAMDHPEIDPSSDLRWYLDVIDFVFTVVFTVEMCLHIVAVGFTRGTYAYLKTGWNKIDFVIVIVSWVDYLASALEIGFLRTLRLLRALRALRMFNRLRGLKVLIDSLLDSISALSAIFAVAMIVFVGYAILGVRVFKGLFFQCNNSVGVSGVDTCVGTFTDDGAVRERAWLNAYNNFDDVGSALFTLFTVSTSNDWIITAQLAVDAPAQVGQQPVREHSPLRIVYFMVFIVIVNYFFLNLFTGVIYGKYVDRAMEGLTELTKPQLQWLDVLRQLSHAKPRKDVKLIAEERQQRKFGLASQFSSLGFGMLDKTLAQAGNVAMDTAGGHSGLVDDALSKGLGAAGAAVGMASSAVGAAGQLVDGAAQAMLDLVPDFGLGGKALKLVEHRFFDRFIISCIIVNSVMMACTYHNEPPWLTTFFELMNFVFTLIFSVEMALKLLAFGTDIYFSDKWLRFDCFVVVGSWFDLLFTWLDVDAFSSSLFRIIRISRVIGRIGRAFKVLSDSKSTLGLDEIMECLYQALPQLAYIGILVGLILFIFAVLGMNLFGKLAHNGCIGEHSNFERAPQAVMTLLGVATKDRITCTIHATMVKEPFCSEAGGTCGTTGVPQVRSVCLSQAHSLTHSACTHTRTCAHDAHALTHMSGRGRAAGIFRVLLSGDYVHDARDVRQRRASVLRAPIQCRWTPDHTRTHRGVREDLAQVHSPFNMSLAAYIHSHSLQRELFDGPGMTRMRPAG